MEKKKRLTMKVRFVRILVFAVTLFLSTCAAATSVESPDAALTETRWQLVRIAQDDTFAPGRAYVIFRAEKDHTVEGNGGCNRFGGRYTLQGDTLTVGKLRSTRMMCPQMQHENTFLRRLQGSHRYRITGDTLILLEDGIPVLSFEALYLQ